jgi:hypothetical protein
MIIPRDDAGQERPFPPAMLTIIQDATDPTKGTALLSMKAPDGATVEVKLTFGKALLLLVLVRFWEADEDLPESMRGWRHRDVVARDHQDLQKNPYPILDKSVTRYLGYNKTKTAAVFRAHGHEPPEKLTENSRAQGIRIRPGALRVDWRIGHPEPKRPPNTPHSRPSAPEPRLGETPHPEPRSPGR